MIHALYTLSASKSKHEHYGNKQRCQYKGLSYVCVLCAYFCDMRAAYDVLTSLAICALEYA